MTRHNYAIKDIITYVLILSLESSPQPSGLKMAKNIRECSDIDNVALGA